MSDEPVESDDVVAHLVEEDREAERGARARGLDPVDRVAVVVKDAPGAAAHVPPPLLDADGVPLLHELHDVSVVGHLNTRYRPAAARPKPLTVVTNSLEVALVSAGVSSWRVIMPGGTIRPGSTMLAGDPGEEFFTRVHADVCFTGAYAVTGALLTDATLEVASLKRAMMKSARRRVLLVDSSKFRPPAFCTFCELSEIDEVITDDGISPESLAALRAFELKVTVVPMKGAGK